MSPVRKTQFQILEIPKRGSLVLISELGQETGSFKFRAAWSVVSNINAQHFLAASSGNFGQALARAAQLSGKKATIVMPTTSAKIKISAVKSYGAEVILVDTNIESRASCVERIHAEHPEYYRASAYDCSHVIEGNSSLGFEIATSGIHLDRVIAPIGGGGLSSGIIKGLCLAGSSIPVWGAEPLMANDASLSIQKGVLCVNEKEPQTIADGARTVSLGHRNWKILKEGLHGIFEITESEIMTTMAHLDNFGIRVEPTGALSVAAGIRLLRQGIKDRIGCVLSGGNFDEEEYKKFVFQGRKNIIHNDF